MNEFLKCCIFVRSFLPYDVFNDPSNLFFRSSEVLETAPTKKSASSECNLLTNGVATVDKPDDDLLVNGNWCVINTMPGGQPVFSDRIINSVSSEDTNVQNEKETRKDTNKTDELNHKSKLPKLNTPPDPPKKKATPAEVEEKSAAKYSSFEFSLRDPRSVLKPLSIYKFQQRIEHCYIILT